MSDILEQADVTLLRPCIQSDKLNPILQYLDDRHGTLGSERKKLLDEHFKALIDNIVPDYMKIIFQKCDENIKMDLFGEEINKLMKCSKYQLNESIKKRGLSEWEEAIILLKTSDEQRKEILKLKDEVSASKQGLIQNVKDLLATRWKIFTQLDHTNWLFESMRGLFSPLQIAKFIYYVEERSYQLDRYSVWGLKKER